MKKHQVSIVLITEKKRLSPLESLSLQRAMEVFSEFNKYLVIPNKTDPGNLLDPGKVTVIKLADSHFKNVNSYSSLLLSNFFYEHFIDSEFILIYQLDCFAFKTDFTAFFSYDYIGAPWFNSQNHTGNAMIRTLLFRKPILSLRAVLAWYLKKKTSAVGNGGFSLRRIDKFISITKDKRMKRIIASWLKQKRPHEDIFYSFVAPLFDKDFRIADVATAVKFAFETYPQKCYALNHNELPVGCHAWAKHDPDFWRPIFANLNYKF